MLIFLMTIPVIFINSAFATRIKAMCPENHVCIIDDARDLQICAIAGCGKPLIKLCDTTYLSPLFSNENLLYTFANPTSPFYMGPVECPSCNKNATKAELAQYKNQKTGQGNCQQCHKRA